MSELDEIIAALEDIELVHTPKIRRALALARGMRERAVEDGWKPIETAPRPGGTEVLVYDAENDRVFVAHRCGHPGNPDAWADRSGYFEHDLHYWKPLPKDTPALLIPSPEETP